MAVRSRSSAQRPYGRGNSYRSRVESERLDMAGSTSDSEGYSAPSTPKKRRRRTDEIKSDKLGKPKEKPKRKPKTKEALRKEGVAARNECRELRQQIEDKDETIGELMDKIAELQPRSQTLMIDGEQLQSQASAMQQSARSWAIDYGVKGALPVLDNFDQSKAVCKVIDSRAETKSDGENIRNSTAGATLVLQAILSDFIGEEIFQSPYFFLSSKTGGKGVEVMEAGLKALDDVFSMGKGGSRLATLRAMIVQQLYPDLEKQQDLTGPKNVLGYLTADWKRDFCQVQAKAFIEKWQDIMIYPKTSTMETQRQDQLVQVLQKAAQLALQLRTQHIELKYCFPEQAPYNQTVYVPNSNLVELHSSVNVALGDPTLDGAKIQYIVEPLLIGIKAGETNSEKQRKIYGKAVIWLEPGSRLEESKESPVKTVIDLSDDELEVTAMNRDTVRQGPLIPFEGSYCPTVSEDKTQTVESLQNATVKSTANERNNAKLTNVCSTEILQKEGLPSLDHVSGCGDGPCAKKKPSIADPRQIPAAEDNLRPVEMDRVEIDNSASRMTGKRKASSESDDKMGSARITKRRGELERAPSS